MRTERDEWLARGGILVTTDHVIDEALRTIRIRLGLPAARIWWQQVDGSSRLRIENVDVGCADRARALFFRYTDKDFSFTNCTSFAVMKELRRRQVLTLDHHFSQMSFQVLPRAA